MVMVAKKNTRGFSDWLVQRVTALLIGAYACFMVIYLLNNQPMYFAQWHTLFSSAWMRVATFIVVASILWHAWIGLWTVFTDYIKSKSMRLLLEVIVCLLLVGYFAWMIDILWG
jgi:succinate dehydrogenase / fumarate reductase membrane anchor subunit